MATPTASYAPPQYTRQERIFTITGTLLGMLLAALDNTIVSTAGPDIQRSLDIEPSLYAWITTAYLVASTVLIPIYGKLSDLLGRKSVLVFGVVVFVLGSLLCGIAPSAWFLIFARAVQGVGSAALFTSAFAIIADLYPPAERGRISGLFGAVFGLSSVLGPLVGGFITDNFGWHWAFLINLPVGAVALAFILMRMPALKQPWPEGKRRPRVDYAGALWLVTGVVPLLLALSLGKTTVAPGETGFEWGSWQILGLFALAVVGIAAFLVTERRAQDPILDLSLFRNRVFAVGNLSSFVIGGAFLGPIVFLPLFMVNVIGLSATNSGLTITPLSLGIVAGNILSGQLVSRVGKYKPLLLLSLLVLMLAFVILAFTLDTNATQASVTLKMVLLGLGLGPSIPIYTLAIQNAVEPAKTGVATAAATFFRSLGNVVGVAVLGTVFANAFSSQLARAQTDLQASLPPAARAQFAGVGSGSAGAGEGASSSAFDIDKIKKDVAAGLDRQKTTIEQAVRENDPAAVKSLLASEQTPAELRELLRGGGVAETVGREFDTQRDLLTRALRENDPAAKQALLASPNTPAQLRPLLAAPQAPAAAREQALQGALAGLERAERQAVARTTDQIVTSAQRGIDEAKPTILAALDRFGLAFRTAMTNAITEVFRIGLVVVILGFLLTLALPQLPLRKRNDGGPPAAMAD